jgi:hypothetical protein
MRNSFDSQTFCVELEETLTSLLEVRKFLSTTVLVNPTLQERFENRVLVKTKNLQILELLCIAVWFMKNKDSQCLLLVELTNLVDDLSSKDIEKYSYLKILLKSKCQMLLWLEATSKYSTDDFFGLLNDKSVQNRLLNSVKFAFRPNTAVKKPQRKRGYKDKGSRKPPHEQGRTQVLPLLQQEIEREREISLDTLAFLEGFLE